MREIALHGLIVADDDRPVPNPQAMDGQLKRPTRYVWLSGRLKRLDRQARRLESMISGLARRLPDHLKAIRR